MLFVVPPSSEIGKRLHHPAESICISTMRFHWLCSLLTPLACVLCCTLSANAQPDGKWSAGVIDTFVEARHQEQQLTPTPEAPRRTLIRRLSLDLLGLPPTPAEVRTFVEDKSPDAYDRLVERLLGSPRFGERMAQFWLDLARYADSDGYHDDTNRAMWPYRDWVIDAFNSNKAFDAFTVEQLAGDLLPNPSIEQLVATAFHRNAPTTSEDGANPEEYRARYTADRVNTTAQVWLGLTVQCAECHDHKYDEITTQEYYELAAFFNQSPEKPLVGGLYAPPSIAVPNEEQAARLADFQSRIERKQKQMDVLSSRIREETAAWIDELENFTSTPVSPEQVVCEFHFDGQGDQQLANTGARRRAAKFKQTADGSKPKSIDGFLGEAFQFAGGTAALDLGQLFEFRTALPFTFEAWVMPGEAGGPILSKIDNSSGKRGFDVWVKDGRVRVRLSDQWPDATVMVSTVTELPVDQWTHVSVTYDGLSSAEGVYVFVNGELQDVRVELDSPIQTIRNRAALFLGGADDGQSFDGKLDEVRFYKWPLSNEQLVAAPLRRFEGGKHNSHPFLGRYFRGYRNPPTAALRQEIDKLRANKHKLELTIPRSRIMRDVEEHRATHVLVRGDFRSLGERVEAGTPSLLPTMKELKAGAGEATRLELARWLVKENRAQTARVMANRLWALFFGRGIVDTLDDFGVQGSSPTHPELLERLKDEFLRREWDIKSLIREIVLSSTYRQGSNAPEAVWRRDPNNESLSRGPRSRLAAETIRDNALAISGLLSNRIGGPSVKPYQPDGLWREMSKGDAPHKAYVPSHGADLYRRGLYTFWKRSIHYPSFSVFDAPSREVCTSSRPETNTPTQALTLLNDPAYVEMARAFAELMLGIDEFESRIHFAFERAVARKATPREIELFRGTYAVLVEQFRTHPQRAKALLTVGESPVGKDLDPVELASWTTIAQMVLSMDETISKE